MLPIIRICGIEFATFPLIIFVAIFSCIACCIGSKSYKINFYNNFVRLIRVPVLFALCGGKVLYVFSQHPHTFAEWVSQFIYSGFVFYGGLLGGLTGLWVYCKAKNLSFFEYSDLACSILPLGQAIGRIGCFCNGCCYGIPYDGILSVLYPVNGTMIYVFPTWFFESAFTLSLFIYFQFWCGFKYSGQRTGTYLLAYAVFRFALEFARGDAIRGFFGVFSTSQWISSFLIIVGFAIIIHSSRRCTKTDLIYNKEGKW